MPRRIHQFDPPDRFVAGAVGEPGRRTFFLQAREGERLVSVVCEKLQVAALADRLALLLEELRTRGIAVPTERPTETADLEEPIEPAFRAGTMTIAWDTRSEEIILEARAQLEDDDEEEGEEGDAGEEEFDDDDPDGPDLIRVHITPTVAAGFVAGARALVAAGRPPCPWCGQPLDATGHYCPRRNGNRAN